MCRLDSLILRPYHLVIVGIKNPYYFPRVEVSSAIPKYRKTINRSICILSTELNAKITQSDIYTSALSLKLRDKDMLANLNEVDTNKKYEIVTNLTSLNRILC